MLSGGNKFRTSKHSRRISAKLFTIEIKTRDLSAQNSTGPLGVESKTVDRKVICFAPQTINQRMVKFCFIAGTFPTTVSSEWGYLSGRCM